MFKKLLIIGAIIFATYSVNAQNLFEKGDIAVNLGFLVGDVTTDFTPGINASVEYGAFPVGDGFGVVSLGAGLDVGFYSGYYNDYVYARPSVRGAFHLGILNTEKFDVYAGVMSGYTTGYPVNDLFMDDFIGGRMMLSDGFGIYAEVGFISASNLRGGVFFKF
ncbi:MAG: hypothetical protein GXO49_02190 [Chlorobi bacterium]|nr:hypothetical protein [Chlorobiota bacterium]